ncbi:unnamed protein product [Lepeophtheirus salmonis]|uniref:(salmon louse) hypothetical protein n=1 Tax=Lepeophtheirus salmonis TaxID=72036 RepID=A0A7R8CYS9_LEPSM|nr:unnamed protein product [Lepeophtheirus salmonis]CAF2971344.1 unnamed protein product [Lepeophtheirus salmonis]
MGLNAPLLVCLLFLSSSRSLPTSKNQRALGLFNIIRFSNDECETLSSTDAARRQGVCMRTNECETQRGEADGGCAAGFGVCCVLSVSNCGGSITRNTTYIQNPGFPSKFVRSDTTTCTYNIPRSMEGICSIRLDFNTLRIRNASPNDGDCGNEFFTARPGTGAIVPNFCGVLSGQHMYLSSGTEGDLGSITFNFDPNSDVSRMWDIKVAMIPCYSRVVPPDGCLQYYFGIAGTITNYNFGTLLQNTAYNMCIRREIGFCKVLYTVDDTSKSVNPFGLGKSTSSKTSTGLCNEAQLQIPSTISANKDNAYCGDTLSTRDGNDVNAAITSDITPFLVRLMTRKGQKISGSTGFKLQYVQLPC